MNGLLQLRVYSHGHFTNQLTRCLLIYIVNKDMTQGISIMAVSTLALKTCK